MFKSFEKEYEKQEREILVLMSDGGGSGASYGSFWIGQSYFLAYVDIETNELKKGEGRLTWPLTKEEEDSRSYFKRFKKGVIYRIKARRLADRTVPENRTPSFYNKFYVTEVLEEGATSPALDEILTEYRRPIILQDEILGELTLDKNLSNFEGHVMWKDEKIIIYLDVDQNSKATWTKAIKAMKQLVAEQEKWDKTMREFSANELTELANDWQSDEDENAPAITKEDFSKRMILRTVSMSSGGSFSAYYDDDDMFWRHAIVVDGSIKKGIKSADIAG